MQRGKCGLSIGLGWGWEWGMEKHGFWTLVKLARFMVRGWVFPSVTYGFPFSFRISSML